MAIADDIAAIIEQEKALVFPAFDEDAAFQLGCRIRDRAIRERMPIIVDIRLWDRPFFYAAIAGSSNSNAHWARRKLNTVRHFGRASYRVYLEQGGTDQVAGPRHGLAADDFIFSGGGFPIHVTGVPGPIGGVAISGLPSRQDHAVVVDALAGCLGLDVPVLPAD